MQHAAAAGTEKKLLGPAPTSQRIAHSSSDQASMARSLQETYNGVRERERARFKLGRAARSADEAARQSRAQHVVWNASKKSRQIKSEQQ